MPRCSVIIPTHGHGRLLEHAVASIFAQTEQDFEIVIGGDGVSEDTRASALALVANDARVRFLDLPKAPGRGDLNRGRAVAASRAPLIAYLPDDDLWAPRHLETLCGLLEESDLAHTAFVFVDRDDRCWIDLLDADVFPDSAMLHSYRMNIPNCVVGHRRDAYDRLPYGWRTAPPGCAADNHMWLQFLDQSWCRYRSYKYATAVRLPAPMRENMSNDERYVELARWRTILADPALREQFFMRAIAASCDREYRAGRDALRRLNAYRLTSTRTATSYIDFAEIDPWRIRGNPLPEPIARAGDVIRFDARGAGQLFTAGGFGAAEDWGVWIEGRYGEIVLPVEGPLSGAILTLRRCGAPQGPQPALALSVNGEPAHRIASGEDGTSFRISFALPEPRLHPAPHYTLAFNVTNTFRPHDRVQSTDTRELGFGIEELSLA